MTIRVLAPTLATLLLAGCAFTPGDPWGVLEPELRLTFDPAPERLTDEGWLLTSTSYAIEIDALSVRFDAVSVSMQGSAGPVAFDPADPPEGYSLCHNGHCHADDGSLVAYEDIALAASGDGGSSFVVATTSDLVAASVEGSDVALLACPGDCLLTPGVLNAVSVTVLEVGITGRVHDTLPGDSARLPEGGVPLDVTWSVDGAWSAGLAGAVGDDTPLTVHVAAALVVPAALFDGLDWAALLTAGGDGFETELAGAVVGDNFQAHGLVEAEVDWQ